MTEDRKKHFNLNGISFTLMGDIEMARRLVGYASTLGFIDSTINAHNIKQTRLHRQMESGAEIIYTTNHGIKKATIYHPESYREIYYQEQTERDQSSYVFVPAICVKRSEAIGGNGPVPLFLSGGMSVCDSYDWQGVVSITGDDFPYAVSPGSKNVAFMNADSCTQWAHVSWAFDVDAEEADAISSDNGFSPAPYLGNSIGIAGDYIRAEMQNIGAGVPFAYNCWDEYQHLSQGQTIYATHAQQCFSGKTWICLFAPEVQHLCCEIWTTHKYWIPNVYCEAPGHLYVDYEIKWALPKMYAENFSIACPSYFCYYYPDSGACISTEEGSNGRKTAGGPQHRVISHVYRIDYDLVSTDNGDGQEVRFNFNFSETTTSATHLILSTDCSTSQTDAASYVRNKPEVKGAYSGGQVTPSCPIGQIIGNYFVIYNENSETESHSRTCSPWTVQGVGYNYNGDYSNGYYSPCSGPDDETEPIVSCSLCANVNGERMVIDNTEDPDEYFYCSDSHIYDALGEVIFMYAYSKIKKIEDEAGNVYHHAVYTRYGYFVNTISTHVISPIFYPEGQVDANGQTMSTHQVHNISGLRGWGQCAGYIKQTLTSVENFNNAVP